MTTWPAIISFKDEDELLFISDGDEWAIDSDLHCHHYSEGDKLIDSVGKVFDLLYDKKLKEVNIIATSKTLSVNEFESLVKQHLVFLNQCCTSKLSIESYKNGMSLIEKVRE